jgi:hypothetical protein
MNSKKLFAYSTYWQGAGRYGHNTGACWADNEDEAKGIAFTAGQAKNEGMALVSLMTYDAFPKFMQSAKDMEAGINELLVAAGLGDEEMDLATAVAALKSKLAAPAPLPQVLQ